MFNPTVFIDEHQMAMTGILLEDEDTGIEYYYPPEAIVKFLIDHIKKNAKPIKRDTDQRADRTSTKTRSKVLNKTTSKTS